MAIHVGDRIRCCTCHDIKLSSKRVCVYVNSAINTNKKGWIAMQDGGAREEYVACPSRLLIKEICSTWHLMSQVDYQLVLYRFLPVCNMQVEFLRKLCYIKIQSAWIHSRSGNRFRDHVVTKTLHDTCIFIPYVRCAFYIRFRVRGNFPVYFSSTCFFFATKSENRNKVWSFHRQLCLGDATGVLPTRTTEAGFFHPLDRWPSVVWRT